MTSIIIPLNRTLANREFEFSRKKYKSEYLKTQSESFFCAKKFKAFLIIKNPFKVPLLLVLAPKFKYLKKRSYEF